MTNKEYRYAVRVLFKIRELIDGALCHHVTDSTLPLEEKLRHISAYALELADKIKGERMSRGKRKRIKP